MGGTLIFGNQTPSQREEGSFTHMEGIMPTIGWKNPLYNSVIVGIENGHPLFDCWKTERTESLLVPVNAWSQGRTPQTSGSTLDARA